MFARLSVKRPYVILVLVIIALVLGGVSLTRMKSDLLPKFDIPYLAVITTDIGASPEQVQVEVTDVLESSLATVTGVQGWSCTSAENFSMIFLEFADGTDMDSALVKVSAAVNQVSSLLPETAGTPTYMEISMDMMASMYVGVSNDNMTLAELSEFAEDTIVPSLERQPGVADVAVTGSVVNTITIELNQYKIDNVNQGILGQVNSQLANGRAQLDSAASQLAAAEAQLDASQAALNNEMANATSQYTTVAESMSVLTANQGALIAMRNQAFASGDTATAMQIQAQIDALGDQISGLSSASGSQVQTALTFTAAQSQLDNARATLASSRGQIESGYAQLNDAQAQARSQANVGAMLDIQTLTQLIGAQNFQMPAGYIGSESGTQWMVEVGEKYDSAEQLEAMVLTHIDGLGDITLGDVADVVTTDNVGTTYANMNGADAIVLSITKASTANTSEMSKAVTAQMDRLMADNDGLSMIKVMDQGEYVDLYIWTILRSLLLGAVLAIIVLALFLRDVRPTIIVAFSIPFSVLLAIVLMYFSGLELNIMTLGAMSIAIGMLVDNSIVVMENIYRMRGRGMSAARAAAQGARQVSGAVVASTLTTICVFLPMVFTSGTVRELMVPFALTIGFVLVCSLLVAMTVVPAIASKLFKTTRSETRKSIGRLQEKYGDALKWCLAHKAPVLVLAVVLLGVSIAGVINMGIVLLPNMTSNQLMLTLEMPEDMEREEAYEVADEAVQIIAEVDGVADVGGVDMDFTSGMVSPVAGADDDFSGAFIIYVQVDEDKVHTERQMNRLSTAVQEACADLPGEVFSSDSMGSYSDMMGSGLSLRIYGNNKDEVIEASEMVIEAVESVEGYTNAVNQQTDADPTLHVYVDKDKAARIGTTVAQIYAALATDMSNTATAFVLTDTEGQRMDVVIDNEDYIGLTRENLMSWTFTDNNGGEHALSEVATIVEEPGLNVIHRNNGAYSETVSAEIEEGYNTTLLIRELQPILDDLDLPGNCTVQVSGTDETIDDMMRQMTELIILGFLLLYLIMVAQFGSLLAPFIIIFTVPLAFTGGLLALLITGEQLSVMSLMGFVILMGTVVNNGIVFVDYANQLRLGGMAKRPALIATGRTRMRPILMTALTTILAMCSLIFSPEIGSSMQRGMALVVAGGLLYATIMTLFVVPIVYDIFCRRPLRPINLGSDLDDEINDAEEFIAEMGEEARETYEYESRRDRRRRLKMEGGAHSAAHIRKEELAAAAAGDAPDGEGE